MMLEEGILTASDTDTSDRRSKARFQIRREMRYKVRGKGRALQSGSGSTVNIGSGGVAFRSDQPLAAGVPVELSISWPALLHEVCPMRLIVFGHILRVEDRNAVCSVERYEFRTQGALQTATFAGSAVSIRDWMPAARSASSAGA
jgi:hypothetical protein